MHTVPLPKAQLTTSRLFYLQLSCYMLILICKFCVLDSAFCTYIYQSAANNPVSLTNGLLLPEVIKPQDVMFE